MRIVRELMQTMLDWMPGYYAIEDKNLMHYWHLRTSAKGRSRGTIVFDHQYGLRVRLDDADLVKELRTKVLINNMEGAVTIYYINPRLPHASD
ncbi:hypothetical protein SBP1_gp087 [Vibrio virus vB_VspP_SBP1]|uniref:Uncharacterized protein n=1 Tax=Vibrio virus vB_VspP_SBP1 TaxID=2500581 RepID=A0A3T0IIT7_9CAUD|nr:hypothetical protein KNU36_gp042 [Vibrio virus vB_VspP_SBP1]AZU99679.1 hypothetical protein SBP1_gp087 [Vibrio virus vB_VspP_SBP1]